MPQEIKSIRNFVVLCGKDSAKQLTIKSGEVTKFKLRYGSSLFTLKIPDAATAVKIETFILKTVKDQGSQLSVVKV